MQAAEGGPEQPSHTKLLPGTGARPRVRCVSFHLPSSSAGSFSIHFLRLCTSFREREKLSLTIKPYHWWFGLTGKGGMIATHKYRRPYAAFGIILSQVSHVSKGAC